MGQSGEKKRIKKENRRITFGEKKPPLAPPQEWQHGKKGGIENQENSPRGEKQKEQAGPRIPCEFSRGVTEAKKKKPIAESKGG